MSGAIRVNISVSEEMHEFYKEKARSTGVSMSSMMSFALMQQMMNWKQVDKKMRS